MTQLTDDSIVLSGCGWITPFAEGSITDILTEAASARQRRSDNDSFWAIPDQRIKQYPNLSKELQRDKGAWITAIAVEHAIRSATLDLASCDRTRVGVILGCGLAGQTGMIEFADEVRAQSVRFVSPIHFPQTVGNYIAAALARAYQLRGPNITLASGIASGLNAIIEACRMIDSGKVDILLAGGTERLSDSLALGLSQPNVTLSEGSCIFVIERFATASARGAKPLASLVKDFAIDDQAGHSTIVSTAGTPKTGAVFMESAIGRCMGAAGASAVAAAIGAASGATVPIVNEDSSITGGTFADAPSTGLVLAGVDGEQVATFALRLEN